MDKIIMLVIAVTVFLIAGLSTMFMFSDVGGDQSDVNEAATQVRCETQVEQYCSGGADISEVEDACISQVQNSCGIPEDQMNEQIAERGGLPTTP